MQSKVERNDLGNDVASASFPEFFLTTSHKEFFPPLEGITCLDIRYSYDWNSTFSPVYV